MPVAAIVGGVAAIGGGLIASNAAKKQAGAITDASNQNNATQLQIFNQQRQDLMPWMKTGTAALSQIEQLLGLKTPAPQPVYGHTGAWMPPGTPYVTPNGSRFDGGEAPGLGGGMLRPEMLTDASRPNALSMASTQTSPQPVGQPQQVQTTGGTAGAGQFDSFYNSPGYQFRLAQGQRQLNTGLASRGGLFSGDAGRAAIEYGQNFASNEFDNHLNRLFNVAGMGQVSTGQSNALAGNYVNNVSQNNMTAAQAKSSSYGAQANAWGNVLGTLGGIGMRYF